MYKWPQGRVIRTICLLLVGIIAADLFFSPGGALGHLTVGTDANAQGNTQQLAMGIFFAVATLAVLIVGVMAVGFKPMSVDFLIEVEQEMVKVEWPTGKVLVRSTIVIALATVVLGAIIYVVDFVNVNLLLHWLPALFSRIPT